MVGQDLHPMRAEHVQRYLERIGASAPVRPTYEALTELTLRHVESVPFENLSIHLGELSALDEESLLHKVVDQRRGGVCYELNGLFAGLLRALGYEVDLLAARAWRGSAYGLTFGHTVLRVHGPAPALVDVGFGNRTVGVVPWEAGVPASGFGLAPDEHGDVVLRFDGEVLYRMETRPRELADFVPTWWWFCNSPDSWATNTMFCIRAVPGGRRMLSAGRLIDVTPNGRTEKLVPADEILDCYRAEFGLHLPRRPVMRYSDADSGSAGSRAAAGFLARAAAAP